MSTGNEISKGVSATDYEQQVKRLKRNLFDCQEAAKDLAQQATKAEAERDDLAAELKALREQEPVAFMHDQETRRDCVHIEVLDFLQRANSHYGCVNKIQRIPLDTTEHYTIPLYARPVPAEPVNARLLEALHSTIDLLWLEGSCSVEFDGTVMFGPSYDFSGLDRRIEFLWPGFNCIVWPGSGWDGKWSAYCTYEGSLWFEKFETKEQAKDQCLRLLDQVMPNHPVSKARDAIAAAEAQQERLLQDMHDAGREIDRVMAEAAPKAVRLTLDELDAAAKEGGKTNWVTLFQRIETAVLRKNGIEVAE